MCEIEKAFDRCLTDLATDSCPAMIGVTEYPECKGCKDYTVDLGKTCWRKYYLNGGEANVGD